MERTKTPSGAMIALALTMLTASLGVSIANIALPTLAQAFGASFAQVQWVTIAYLLAVTTLVVGAGRLGDVLGHRRVLLWGIGLFTAASALCAAAPDLWFLVVARVAQGAGGAVLMAVTMALVRDTVAKDRIGSAMGLLGTMSAIGTALGPSLGGFLIAGFGWRSIFIVMVPLGLAGLALGWRCLSPSVDQRKAAGFDLAGTAVLGVSLAAYALSVTIGGAPAPWLALGAAFGIAVFLLIEARVKQPLFRPADLIDPVLGPSLTMNLAVAAVMMATLVVGPVYLSRALHLGAAEVGLVMSVGPMISIFSGVPAGRVVDRLGPGLVVVIGLAAMAFACVALAFLTQVFGVTGYVAAMVLLTPGYQLFQAANNTGVMMGVDADERGVVSGMLGLSRNLGLVTGASVMGAVFAFGSGVTDVTQAAPDAVATGMQVTFLVAAALIALALVPALAARRRA